MTHHLDTSQRLKCGSVGHLSFSSPEEGLGQLQPWVANCGHGDMRPASAGTGQQSLPIDSHTGLDAHQGRRKHRRKKTKKRRNWRPFYQLSWEERRMVDEKDTVRAIHRRQEMFVRGRPMAPYNTTQYLMEVHYGEEPSISTRASRPSGDSDHMEVNGHKDGSRRPRNAREVFLQRPLQSPRTVPSEFDHAEVLGAAEAGFSAAG